MTSEFYTEKIDHKDLPGEYRQAVFRYVRDLIGTQGRSPERFAEFCGEWVCDQVLGEGQSTSGTIASEITIKPSGEAPSKSLDSRWECPRDRWELKENGCLAQSHYVKPMPEFGINHPGYQEEWLHVLFISDDEFVTFNGDASLVMKYKRKYKKT
ncbi:hypothetical protein [Microbulbifer sediminum]|uniref:hypothetical protein n=1 Tax=Microbulbifer sediminum TaxID=2904250 RepID=UPI001F24F06A|nr:hypothetical protein [Microbulbifer sediminum]